MLQIDGFFLSFTWTDQPQKIFYFFCFINIQYSSNENNNKD